MQNKLLLHHNKMVRHTVVCLTLEEWASGYNLSPFYIDPNSI